MSESFDVPSGCGIECYQSGYASMWMKCCIAGCQGISMCHRSDISGIHCMKATKYTTEESTLVLKPMADITRNPKQGYRWPHKKGLIPPKKLFNVCCLFSIVFLFRSLCFGMLKWIFLIQNVGVQSHFKIDLIQSINVHILVRIFCHFENTREGHESLRNI